MLPEIAQLSLEGHSSRAIGRKLGVPRRTVDRWLRQLRQQWAESAAENAAERFAVAMARLESVYREAMEAWRRSLADKQVTVETLGSDGRREGERLAAKDDSIGTVRLARQGDPRRQGDLQVQRAAPGPGIPSARGGNVKDQRPKLRFSVRVAHDNDFLPILTILPCGEVLSPEERKALFFPRIPVSRLRLMVV